MGLDGVELVLAFEERFGVGIGDAEAEACITPRHVIDIVFGKLRSADESVCVSQRAFHILRRSLADRLSVPRRDVLLDTDIRRIVYHPDDRQLWADLKQAVEARSWPGLEGPPPPDRPAAPR